MRNIIPASELTALIQKQSGALLFYARRWFPHGAEDVVQNAFLALVRENCQKKPPDNPIAWLYRTIRNDAISQGRAEARRKTREEAVAKSDLVLEPTEPTIFDATDITESLNRLDATIREIVFLRIWAELSFDEIAKTTGLSRSKTFRLYREGLETMKKELTK